MKGIEQEICIRCDNKLHTDEDLLTGICTECWTDEDNEEWNNVFGEEE